MDNPEFVEASIVIQKYIPRITVCLEEIALGLNYLRRLENDEVRHDGSKIAYNFGYKKYKEETTELERT